MGLEQISLSHANDKDIGMTDTELAQIILAQPFPSPDIAMAIVLAESGGDPTIIHTAGNTPPSRDRGLWQINDHWHSEVTDDCAFDPDCSTQAAFRISKNGTDFNQWSAYKARTHTKFLARAQAAIEVVQQGTNNMSQPDWLTVTRTTGFPRWEIVEYDYISVDDECNNGGVNAYLKALDTDGTYKAGDTVYWATPDEAVSFVMQPEGSVGYCYDDAGKEVSYGIAIPMSGDSSFDPSPPRSEHGSYSAYMADNSDKISGMGLPLRRHVQFTVVWQWKTEGTEPPPPPPPAEGEWVIKRQTADRIVLVRK